MNSDHGPQFPQEDSNDANRRGDEGGLRAPPGLTGWRKAWWWFDFIILVKLARLRFIAILVVIGVVITQWDTLVAYYDKWTRPAGGRRRPRSDVEYFCPMHPTVDPRQPQGQMPDLLHAALEAQEGRTHEREPLPAGIVNRVQLSPYRVVLAGVQTWPVDYLPLTQGDHRRRLRRVQRARPADRLGPRRRADRQAVRQRDRPDGRRRRSRWRRSTAPTWS